MIFGSVLYRRECRYLHGTGRILVKSIIQKFHHGSEHKSLRYENSVEHGLSERPFVIVTFVFPVHGSFHTVLMNKTALVSYGTGVIVIAYDFSRAVFQVRSFGNIVPTLFIILKFYEFSVAAHSSGNSGEGFP
jgi:hypothetical protein